MSEEKKKENISEIISDKEIIINQKNGIVSILMRLLTACKNNNQILDTYYDDLNTRINYIQTSVIFFSTISAFLQGLRSEIFIPNTTSFIITLIISTYISLVLSLSKFFKLDEKKENVHNIRQKYSDFHNKIRYSLDKIKPWNSEGYINKYNINNRKQEWKSVINEYINTYENLIEIKQELFIDYEKVLDSKKQKKYENIMIKDNLNYKIKINKIKDLIENQYDLESEKENNRNNFRQEKGIIKCEKKEIDKKLDEIV